MKQWIVLFVGLFMLMSGFGATVAAEEAATVYFGKVTAVDGNTITVALMSGGFSSVGQPPQGNGDPSQPPQMPSDPSGQADKPAGQPDSSDGTTPQPGTMPGVATGRHDGGMEMELTGEVKTITITDESMISIQGRGETTQGTLNDIVVDGILSISVTVAGDGSEIPTAVVVMGSGVGDAGRADNANPGN